MMGVEAEVYWDMSTDMTVLGGANSPEQVADDGVSSLEASM